jgi:hypothetical protein
MSNSATPHIASLSVRSPGVVQFSSWSSLHGNLCRSARATLSLAKENLHTGSSSVLSPSLADMAYLRVALQVHVLR